MKPPEVIRINQIVTDLLSPRRANIYVSEGTTDRGYSEETR